MKKERKIFLGLVITLLALAIVSAAVGILFLDKIVKTGVETVGPQITKVSIKLDEVHIGLLTGSAKVKGLVIGNPEGYKAPEAIRVGVASVGVNSFSILSDKIVVHSVVVDAPEITFEGGLGGNNLSKIMDNVNGTAQQGGVVATNSAGKPKPSKKIEVDDFLITGAKVHVTLTSLGGREMTLPLPEIHLTNLGKGSDGLTPTELTRAVFSAILTETTKAVSSAAATLGKDAAGIGVNKIKNGIGGLFGK
jgi:uncharacterized protein involved in outer membrane biogenesis